MIPDRAVEAAAKKFAVSMWGRYDPDDVPRFSNAVREMLEAAAPYMKPRTITTAEELDALPNGATIKTLIGGEPVGRTWGKVEGEWWGLAIHGPDIPILPAVLIHEGYPA